VRAILRAWLNSIRKDPDLGKDLRMMVPIFYDVKRSLDRAEFREHCARHKTYRAILSNLQ